VAEGEELPPVVATLVGDDESFLAMLERDAERARALGAEIQDALNEGLGGVSFSGSQITGEGIGAAGEAIGEQLATGVGEGFDTQVPDEIEATIRELNAPLAASMAEAGAEAGSAFSEAAVAELEAWREAVAEASGMGASIPGPVGDVFTQVDAGAISAAQAVAQLEASMDATGQVATISESQFNAAAAALRTVGASSGLTIEQLKSVSVSFADAQVAAEQYGTSEAQLALSSRALTEAQAALADSNASLVQSYLVMSASGSADLDGLTFALEAVASAQGDVTAMAQAQIDALTAVNLAVIENEGAFFDDETALRSLAATAEMAGVELDALALALENGSTWVLDEAAATAQAELKALALEQAQRELAAANLTLVDTYQQLASGAEVSAQQQAAALSAVAAAQREVAALGGAKAGGTAAVAGDLEQTASAAGRATESMGGLAGMMNGPLMQGIYGISAIAFLPMALGQIGQTVSGWYDHAAASASDFTAAVQQDSGAVGDNTIVTIQNALSKSQLSSLSQQLGVSQATLIEYAAGESQAQSQVTSAYNAKAQALTNAAEASHAGASADNAQMTEQQKQLEQLQTQKTQLDQVASAVQQAVQQDRDFTAATMQAEQTEQIFNATLEDGHTKMLAQAQSGALGTVATLGFSDAQSQLNHTLVEAISQYTVAGNQANAYESALLALGGPNSGMVSAAQYGMLLQGALDGVTQKMQDQAQQSALSAVAALQLGDNQTGLNETMMGAVEAYTQANTQASAYATILAALDPHTVTAAQYAMILQGALDGVASKMQQQAQASALSTVGVLDLGSSENDLSQALMGSVQSYAQANAQASAYGTVLGSLGPHTVTVAQQSMLLQDALDASAPKLQAQASGTALAAVAALQLGGDQAGMNLALYDAVDAYSQAAAQAGGYTTALTALSGSEQGMLAAEAQVTIGLAGVAKAAAANGTSLDINNEHGAQNIATFTQLSQAADKAAESIYQNDVNTGHASQAFSDANHILDEERQAFIAAADKAGFNKDAVKALADELYQLPKSIPIDVEADTNTAIAQANGVVRYIDSLTGTITIAADNGSGIAYNPSWGGGKASYDLGGWVDAPPGVPVDATVHGREFVLTPDMLAGRQAVDPQVLSALGVGYASPVGLPGLGGGAGSGPAAGGPVTIVANIYLDSQLVGKQVMTGTQDASQAFARRNSITGFAASYR
jgi:hypothetical protein